jgi:predicted kinase
MIHLLFGPLGAGKSTLALQLADQQRGVRLSIDDWMLELYGPDRPQTMDLSWVVARVQRCERRIWAVTTDLVQRGGTAVLDLGCLQAADRARFAAQARALGLPLQPHYVTAPRAIRRQRVLQRNQERGATFAFEVTPGMFDFMESRFEPPSADELAGCRVTETA